MIRPGAEDSLLVIGVQIILNLPSQSSPTGTQFLNAVGAALAIRKKRLDGYCLCKQR